MADSLRDRLVEARLTSDLVRMDDGYMSIVMLTQEEAADRAVGIFAEWLRDESDDIEVHHNDDVDAQHGPIVTHLRWLADSIARSAEEPT